MMKSRPRRIARAREGGDGSLTWRLTERRGRTKSDQIRERVAAARVGIGIGIGSVAGSRFGGRKRRADHDDRPWLTTPTAPVWAGWWPVDLGSFRPNVRLKRAEFISVGVIVGPPQDSTVQHFGSPLPFQHYILFSL